MQLLLKASDVIISRVVEVTVLRRHGALCLVSQVPSWFRQVAALNRLDVAQITAIRCDRRFGNSGGP